LVIASVYIIPGRAWRDADITQLLSFRSKSFLAGDLNAKHPFWNSAVSNTSYEKLLASSDLSNFKIAAPQCPTHYSPAGNGDVLDIVFHQIIRVSDIIVSDIMDSYHLPIIFHILDHVKISNLSECIENSEIGIGFKASPRN
jgi:hypothetical protein